MKAAVLTVSDGVASGQREDESGDLLAGLLEDAGYEVEREVSPDDRDGISSALNYLVQRNSLVLTTGGTGFGPRDITPEATWASIERSAPGLAEAIRADSISKTPHGLLSRGISGISGRTLIVNFPGSPGACRDGFEVIRPALKHALELLTGEETVHRQT